MTTENQNSKPSTTDKGARINRREFLNFAWLASLGFILVDLGGVTYLFAMPRFREGEFGGVFPLGRTDQVLPRSGDDPVKMSKGKFWLVHTQAGQVLALYQVCTHLGCLYNWNDQEGKFICPCHGSQFELDGTYILGPAPRSLDRFVVRLLDDEGNPVAITDEQGNPLPLPEKNSQMSVETGDLIRGKTKGIEYPVSSSSGT